MATAPKFVSPPGRELLDPQVKSWIDNVIVPALLREFLEQSELSGSKSASAMVECSDSKALCGGVHE